MQEAKNKLANENDYHSYVQDADEFAKARNVIEFAIEKSCLLDRMIYGGEQPSQTPCPVHKGRWSGIQFGWPDGVWSDGKPIEEASHLRKYYDEGCRCYQHKCGCTTGWQPDEHCGCGVKE